MTIEVVTTETTARTYPGSAAEREADRLWAETELLWMRLGRRARRFARSAEPHHLSPLEQGCTDPAPEAGWRGRLLTWGEDFRSRGLGGEAVLAGFLMAIRDMDDEGILLLVNDLLGRA